MLSSETLPLRHLRLDILCFKEQFCGCSENIHAQLCNPWAEVGNYLGIKDELFRDRVWQAIDFHLVLRPSEYF